MKRVTLPLWGLALGAVVLWGLSRWDASVTRQEAVFVEQATRALDQGRRFRFVSDSLRRLAGDASRRAQVALSRTITLSASVDSLKKAFPRDTAGMIPGATVDSVLRVYDLRDSLRLVAIAELTRLGAIERMRADAAEARVVALEKVVAQGIKVVDCRLLGIGFLPRCPSRAASFGIGAGAGALAVLLAR